MAACPTNDELSKWLAEQLSDTQCRCLEAHIENCLECQSVLDALTTGVARGEMSGALYSADSVALAPSLVTDLVQSLRNFLPLASQIPTQSLPESIGEYRIIRELGRGGMGIVYEAEQQSLGRRVAVKILPAGLAHDPAACERFQREAQAAAALHHTNIVPIFEVGEYEGLPFYAMQLITGESLEQMRCRLEVSPSSERVRTGHTETSVPERVDGESNSASKSLSSGSIRNYYQSLARITSQVADALAYAHQKGIIHRDVKPSNLLLDDSGSVWVTDFGLAKTTDSALTQTGDVVGTLQYISPERFEGQCDERADVYALGITLYELLTLRRAFEGAERAAIMQSIMGSDPIRPRTIDSKICKELETIVLMAIDREPSRRYQSATEMAADLRRYLDDQPIVARRATLPEQLALWRRRNPALAGTIAALLVVLVAGVTATSWKWREADQQRAVAQTQTIEARTQRDEARWQNYRANLTAASSALELRNAESLKLAIDASETEFRGWEWHYFRNQLTRWVAEFDANVLDVKVVAGLQFREAGSTLVASCLTREGASRSAIFDVNKKRRITETADFYAPVSFYQPATPREAGAELGVVSHSGRYRTKQAQGKLLLQKLKKNTDEITNEVILAPDNNHAVIPAFSDDDRFVACWCEDQVIRIWDTATGKLAIILEGHQPLLTLLQFSPDGSKILGAGFTAEPDWPAKQCTLWDATTGEQVLNLNRNGEPRVRIHQFSADGRLVVTGREFPSNAIEIWDIGKGKKLAELRAHANTIGSLALSKDSSRLIAVSFDRTATVWDLSSYRLIRQLKGPSELPGGVFFDPDESSMLILSARGAIQIRDMTSFHIEDAHMTQTLQVVEETLSPDTNKLAMWFENDTIRLWDLGRSERSLIRSHSSYVYDAKFSCDGSEIASVGWDNTLRIHDVATGQQRQVFSSGDDALLRLSYSPDGSRVLATFPGSEFGGRIYVWTTKPSAGNSAKPVIIDHSRPHARVGESFGATFSADSQRVIAGSSVEKLYVWNAESGVKEQVVSAKGLPPISDISLSPDGKRFITAGGCITLWDATSLDRIATLGTQDDRAYSATWSADSKSVAVIDEESTVTLWSIENQSRIATLRHGALVYDAAFHPDGTRLATACDDHTIRLWDLQRLDQVAELRQHDSYVHSVDFSPDGTRIVSASGDQTMRIWENTPDDKSGVNSQPVP